ncbi:hypothetical protein VNI00_002465 [Paramarasmius palmivorus]|uniref:RNA polymerase II-associated protein 1 C-terminal domain-containing protein n=1 Tax=Paramarasmius palmivorus TaxID=297713 RepID=A0AAW0DWS9_9AGAR
MQLPDSTDLLGSVIERKPSNLTPKPPAFSPTAKAGFPSVQHRSKGKSAFARNIENQKKTPAKDVSVPQVIPHSKNTGDWRDQISRENEERVRNMTDEERERERQEILERFGSDVGDILRRAREARERKEKAGINMEPIPVTTEIPPTSPSRSGSPPPSALSASSTRPNSPSRGSRKLRFAQIVPEDVHVYESAPPSPRKRSLLALPPPSASDSDAVSLGTLKNVILLNDTNMTSPSDEAKASDQTNLDVRMKSPPRDEELPNPISSFPNNPNEIGAFDQTNLDIRMNSPSKNEESSNPFTSSTQPTSNETPEPDEGTPEYIRRRYFPSAPADNPDIAWMVPPSLDGSESGVDQLRFDLNGHPISSAKSLSLPTHLGLHHHAEGKHAGYTLDDIFLLSRSKVPAQRAAMLGVLKGIIAWWRENKGDETDDTTSTIEQLQNASPSLLKRVLFAGLEALPERGVVGVRAVEIVWECIVGWDPVPGGTDEDQYYEWGGIELGSSELIDGLPLADVLPQLVSILTAPPDGTASTDTTPGTPVQHLVLSILHRIAYHSNKAADQIASTSKLAYTIIRTFIVVPTSSSSSTLLSPDPRALRFLTTLSQSSRANAKSLTEPADMFLRLLVTFKSTAPTTIPTQTLLAVIEIMHFYTSLARYGMYAHIATDAREVWWKIGEWIKEVASSAPSAQHLKVISAWAGLLEAWMVCATDPHRTTPSHDLLWSQVAGWEWGKDLLELVEALLSLDLPDVSTHLWRVRAAVCRALAAWLEGSQVNGIKGGEEERFACIALLSKVFSQGKVYSERNEGIVEEMKSQLAGLILSADPTTLAKLGHDSYELMSIIRVWLACCPPSSQEPMSSPPFELPFAQISELCAGIVRNDGWRANPSTDILRHSPLLRLFRRPITSLLATYLRFSRQLPGVSEDIWLAQAFAVMLTLLPGDEDHGLRIVDDVLCVITEDWAKARSLDVPQVIWQKGGWDAIRPFLLFEVNPDNTVFPSPLSFSPRSISSATTQRLPLLQTAPRTEWAPSGLPLRKDWILSPLDHVLHSGNASSLFSQQGLFPSSFEASETEIVRAALLLAQISREVIRRFANALAGAALSREEAVLGCMKVFMLEHEQDQNQNTQEVFRDSIVGRYMDELIAPYTLGADSNRYGKPESSGPNLEQVAIGFLGSSTPFYQYYTDFVALYDSISFSHPTFARLLLPPTSMRYPIDYRKHLWDDFSHIVRTIRTPMDQVISEDIREYLWPVETDPQMVGAYLRALIKHGHFLEGFVRLVAIHHIACNIWPDLCDESAEESPMREERANKLFKAVVDQCEMEVVREVVKYKQRTDGAVVLPPSCFESQLERLEVIERWGGPHVVQRLEGLFRE